MREENREENREEEDRPHRLTASPLKLKDKMIFEINVMRMYLKQKTDEVSSKSD